MRWLAVVQGDEREPSSSVCAGLNYWATRARWAGLAALDDGSSLSCPACCRRRQRLPRCAVPDRCAPFSPSLCTDCKLPWLSLQICWLANKTRIQAHNLQAGLATGRAHTARAQGHWTPTGRHTGRASHVAPPRRSNMPAWKAAGLVERITLSSTQHHSGGCCGCCITCPRFGFEQGGPPPKQLRVCR